MFNNTSFIDKKNASLISVYIALKTPLTLFISITSIILIAGTILIALKEGIWLSTRMYMTVMGVVDLLALILFIAFNIEKSILNMNIISVESVEIWFKIKMILAELLHGLIFISNWITVLLGFERYIAVCYPLYSRRIDFIHRKIAIIIIFVVVFLFKLPIVITIYISRFLNRQIPNNTIYKIYNHIQLWIITLFLFLVVPFLLLAMINLQLITAVRKSSRFLRQYSNQNPIYQINNTRSEEQKITLVLIGIIVIFFIFQAPFGIYVTLQSFNIHSINLRGISSVLLSLKSIVHFFLYCWFCEKFRKVLCHLLCSNHRHEISIFTLVDQSTQQVMYPISPSLEPRHTKDTIC